MQRSQALRKPFVSGIDTAKEFADPIPEPKGRRLIFA
jgi:hypothetical protein